VVVVYIVVVVVVVVVEILSELSPFSFLGVNESSTFIPSSHVGRENKPPKKLNKIKTKKELK